MEMLSVCVQHIYAAWTSHSTFTPDPPLLRPPVPLQVSMHEDVVNITILEGSTSMYESFTYRIDVSAGAFKDVAETPNQFEGLTYTFQTGYDTRPPVVFSTTPMPNGDIPVQSTTLVIR